MDSLNQSNIGVEFNTKEYPSMDIICLSIGRSDSYISSTGLFLAKEFANKNRVFFIDHPYSWKDFLGAAMNHLKPNIKRALALGKISFSNPEDFPKNLTVVNSGLTLPINFLPSGFIYNCFLKLNDLIVTKAINACVKSYGIKDFIFINFSDPFFFK